MKTLSLKNGFQNNHTIVENEFIDVYMASANGEYVKVYLLLLRHLYDPRLDLTISSLADRLDCTEKDIIRALHYWSEAKLLTIDYDASGAICGLSLGKTTTTSISREEITQAPANKSSGTKSSLSPEDLQQLLFVTEQYMGRPLSVSDIQKIYYFIEELHMSLDLIEYLIEYCVENNHKSIHYIESVAVAWAEAGITTVSGAKEHSSFYNKNCFAILNAFGIRGRNPAPFELEYIKKWTGEYGFTLDVVLEACNRTIANAHKPDFKYTDSILSNWFVNNVHHLSDISRLDLAHQKKKKPKPVTNSRFQNFEGRSYDMSSLEEQLLNTN